MASKEQYEFFKGQFADEDARNNVLANRAQIFLSIVSLLFTGLIFKLNDLKGFALENRYLLVILVLIVLSLFCGAFYLIQSIKIRDYSATMTLLDWTKEVDDKEPTDSEFFNNRIADFIVATTSNQKINNKKGNQLKVAGYCILCSIIFIGIFILLVIT